MGIASLTAASLARPLHTLHRWWQQLHPASSARVHTAWVQDGESTTLHISSVVSVLTWRRSRSKTAGSPLRETASEASERGLALPALWRMQHRAASARNCEMRLDAPLRHKFQHSAPALRVLHRPANLAKPGGLVIAGRMADVCAELDRLVAMEALH